MPLKQVINSVSLLLKKWQTTSLIYVVLLAQQAIKYIVLGGGMSTGLILIENIKLSTTT